MIAFSGIVSLGASDLVPRFERTGWGEIVGRGDRMCPGLTGFEIWVMEKEKKTHRTVVGYNNTAATKSDSYTCPRNTQKSAHINTGATTIPN